MRQKLKDKILIISVLKECKEYTNLYRDERVDKIFGDVSYGPKECAEFGNGQTIIGGEKADPAQYPAMVHLS